MKPALVRAIRIGAIVAVGAVAIWMLSRLEIRGALSTARTADPAFLSAAVALMVLSLGTRVLRSLYLFRAVGWHQIPGRTIALVTLIGFSLSKITPGGSGDLLRATAFKNEETRPLDVAAVVLYERGLDLLAMLGLLGIGLVALTAGWPVAIGAALAAMVLGFGFVRQVVPALTALPLGMPMGAMRLWVTFDSPRLRPLLHGRVASVSGGLTFANFASEALRAYLVYQALGLDTGVAGVLVLLFLPYTVGLLSLIPLGIGSWDATAALAVERLGFPLEAGAAAALLLRAVLTVPTLLAGLAAWLMLRASTRPQRVVQVDEAPVQPADSPSVGIPGR